MNPTPLQILSIVGSTNSTSTTRIVLDHLHERLEAPNIQLDLLDLSEVDLPIFRPNTTYTAPYYAPLQQRVLEADVLILGTPDYHGSVSGSLKNFVDHFWKEYAGKLFVSVVGSYEKGLTVTDQIRTMARQCYAWALPYAIVFHEKEDLRSTEIINPTFAHRLDIAARDIRTYGALLKQQRLLDLQSSDPCFMARYRPVK